jgi:hypothetical protein
MRRERRRNFRLGWHLPATIYDASRHLERPCILVDISNGGAKIARVRAHTIPDEFRLKPNFLRGHIWKPFRQEFEQF